MKLKTNNWDNEFVLHQQGLKIHCLKFLPDWQNRTLIPFVSKKEKNIFSFFKFVFQESDNSEKTNEHQNCEKMYRRIFSIAQAMLLQDFPWFNSRNIKKSEEKRRVKAQQHMCEKNKRWRSWMKFLFSFPGFEAINKCLLFMLTYTLAVRFVAACKQYKLWINV